MNKSITIDTEKLIPYIDKDKFRTLCSKCDKAQAKWDLVLESGIIGPDSKPIFAPICSICFLYSTSWGSDHKDQVKETVLEFEEIKKEDNPLFKYELDLLGRLLRVDDADFLLLWIARVSRQVYLDRMEKS